MEFLSSDLFMYFIIPLLILLSRVMDVSMGTVRIILASKGIKLYAALIGFFEVLIWILALTTIMNNLTNVFSYIAYALGFSIGTYLGIMLEERIAIGQVRLRVISKKDLTAMIDDLKPTKYVFVNDSVNSSEGKIKIINAFLERKHLKNVIKKVKERDPEAFYTVEDLKMIKETYVNKSTFSFLRKMK